MSSAIYTLRIELEHITPLIWRRIAISSDATFWDLHVAIQDAMGWNDSHLHQFEIPRERGEPPLLIGIPSRDDELSERESRPLADWEKRIGDHVSRQSPELQYIYDFGDDWSTDSYSRRSVPRRWGLATRNASPVNGPRHLMIRADPMAIPISSRSFRTKGIPTTLQRIAGREASSACAVASIRSISMNARCGSAIRSPDCSSS